MPSNKEKLIDSDDIGIKITYIDGRSVTALSVDELKTVLMGELQISNVTVSVSTSRKARAETQYDTNKYFASIGFDIGSIKIRDIASTSVPVDDYKKMLSSAISSKTDQCFLFCKSKLINTMKADGIEVPGVIIP